MNRDDPATASFVQRMNNPLNRGWGHRAGRFLRARLQAGCLKVARMAADPRVLEVWRHGWDEDHCRVMQRWRDEGFRPRVVYDIGANEGLWAEACQAILRPEASYLFEPQPDARQRALARRGRLQAAWEVLPFALGDQDASQVLHRTQNAAASSLLAPLVAAGPAGCGTAVLRDEAVQVATMDGVVSSRKLPQPDFVKIDVQGFEGRVIAGGRQTLSRTRRIVVEVSLRAIYQEQSLIPEVFNALTALGFELEDLTDTLRTWPEGRLWQVDLWLKRAD